MPKLPTLISKKELYALQKTSGERDQSGKWLLRYLKPRHFGMIALSAKGISNKDIAKKFGVTEITVSRVLNDPKTKEYLDQVYLGVEQEMRGIAFTAIDAIRQILHESSDPELWIKAVARFESLYKTLTPEGKSSGPTPVAVQMNFAPEDKSDAVEKLIGLVERLAQPGDTAKIVEGEEAE